MKVEHMGRCPAHLFIDDWLEGAWKLAARHALPRGKLGGLCGTVKFNLADYSHFAYGPEYMAL